MKISSSLWLAAVASAAVAGSPGSDSHDRNAVGTNAGNSEVAEAVANNIKATLKERFPDVKVEQVHRSPVPGLLEVLTPDEIVYVDEAANYVLVGKLMETKTHDDLSVTHWDQYHGVNFSTLPLDLAIRTVRGDGSRKIALFEDPHCPFCKKLEEQMQSLTNVTIYTFLYPLEQLHPGATAQANRIWCSKDPAAAWSNWMVHETEPGEQVEKCDTSAINRLQELGSKLRINSTPTIFFANGKRFEGTLPNDQIEQRLQLAKR